MLLLWKAITSYHSYTLITKSPLISTNSIIAYEANSINRILYSIHDESFIQHAVRGVSCYCLYRGMPSRYLGYARRNPAHVSVFRRQKHLSPPPFNAKSLQQLPRFTDIPIILTNTMSARRPAVKAIIFDVGGVCVSNHPPCSTTTFPPGRHY